ncbi:DUF6879 family protein [Kitasatospora camelliae]|uniref:DUF6879 family protein n=1 Tax=Kitasatospora camelliae TaxID=3156397 RepID=A0AAU8JYI2_9ACTN
MKRILTSVVSGGVSYGLTQLTKQSNSTSLIVGTLVGGTVLMVGFLIGFERRLTGVEHALEEHTTEMQTLVGGGFARINEATELFGRVESSRLDTGEVTELVRSALEIGPDRPEIVHGFAQKEIRRLAVLMRELRTGEAAYDGEDRDWLLTLAGSANATIDATSTAVDVGFWTSELGLRYLAAQREAIDRGVKVRRVFILDSPTAEELAEVHRVGRQQAALNVSVRVVTTADLPAPVRLDPMFDFIVFDQAISYEVTPGLPVEQAAQPVIASTRLVLRPDRVARRMRRFNDLWNASEPVE